MASEKCEMGSNSISAGTRARRGRQSKVNGAEKGRLPASDHAASLQEFEAAASGCHTPKQFRELLDHLQTILPFKHLICLWGYPSPKAIRLVFNHSFPIPFLRWYLTEGMLWKGPIFLEWLGTNKAQVEYDVRQRLPKAFDPELWKRAERFNLKGLLLAGVQTRDLWICFALTLGSAQKCRAHLKRFESMVPTLAQALQRACPRPLLTKREVVILTRRTRGEIGKQIATAEGISARTVRDHLQRIKKKLYTDDLVNAVVIAVRSGMLVHSWKD